MLASGTETTVRSKSIENVIINDSNLATVAVTDSKQRVRRVESKFPLRHRQYKPAQLHSTQLQIALLIEPRIVVANVR